MQLKCGGKDGEIRDLLITAPLWNSACPSVLQHPSSTFSHQCTMVVSSLVERSITDQTNRTREGVAVAHIPSLFSWTEKNFRNIVCQEKFPNTKQQLNRVDTYLCGLTGEEYFFAWGLGDLECWRCRLRDELGELSVAVLYAFGGSAYALGTAALGGGDTSARWDFLERPRDDGDLSLETCAGELLWLRDNSSFWYARMALPGEGARRRFSGGGVTRLLPPPPPPPPPPLEALCEPEWEWWWEWCERPCDPLAGESAAEYTSDSELTSSYSTSTLDLRLLRSFDSPLRRFFFFLCFLLWSLSLAIWYSSYSRVSLSKTAEAPPPCLCCSLAKRCLSRAFSCLAFSSL